MSPPIESGAGRCLNCEAPLSGEFCSQCGQRDLPTRLGIGELLREVASETFELDGRIARTLVPFLIQPGKLAREYNEGRRARYTSPFRMFLAMTLLWLTVVFLVDSLGPTPSLDAPLIVDLPEDEAAAERGPVGRWLISHVEAFEALSPGEQLRRSQAALREAVPKAALVMVPVFALLMKLLFVRQRRYYVEHLVFALYLHAFAFLLLAIAAPFESGGLALVLTLWFTGYLYVGLWKGYEAGWWASALRLGVLAVVYPMFLAFATVALLLVSLLMD
ncbi:DUF3667 domain-containing protein [Nannocystaceae bacterium ST9]